MRYRSAAALLALLLVSAACGSSSGSPVAGPGGGANAALLAYGYESGADLTYSFDMSTDMVMDVGGDVPGMDGPMEMGMDMSGRTGYAVSAGPTSGTTRITVEQHLEDFDLRSFTVDGQSMAGLVDQEFTSALAEQGPLPEMSVVIDERGNIVSLDFDGQDVPLGLFGGDIFSSIDPTGGMSGMDSFFGPAFPDYEVGIGDSWTVETPLDMPFLGNPFTITTDYTIIAEEAMGSRTVLVIESTSEADELEMDLLEMIEDLADSNPEDLEALGLTASDVYFMLAAFPPDAEMTVSMTMEDMAETVWFDPAEGILVRSQSEGFMVMDMTMNMGPEGKMDMGVEMSMSMTLQLLGAPADSA